jgi:predicted transcriptional regulator
MSIRYIRTVVLRLSQRALADIVLTSQPSVARWEAGQQVPDLRHMQRIRAAARKACVPWNDTWFFEAPRAVKLKPTVS